MATEHTTDTYLKIMLGPPSLAALPHIYGRKSGKALACAPKQAPIMT
jgi:hypothetical protein